MHPPLTYAAFTLANGTSFKCMTAALHLARAYWNPAPGTQPGKWRRKGTTSTGCVRVARSVVQRRASCAIPMSSPFSTRLASRP